MVEGPPKRGAPAPLQTITLVTRLAHQSALVKCVGLFASGHRPVEVMLDTPMHKLDQWSKTLNPKIVITQQPVGAW